MILQGTFSKCWPVGDSGTLTKKKQRIRISDRIRYTLTEEFNKETYS